MIQTETFIRTVVCGFIATFAMTIISFMQGGLGLPVIDVGHILKESFNHVHTGEPYSIFWGNMAYNVIGVLLALFWVVFLQKRIPGNWVVQGIIYGIIISIIAGLFVSPLAARAAGDTIGFFYTDTWMPGKIMVAGLIMHLIYGLVLTLSLKKAGVEVTT